MNKYGSEDHPEIIALNSQRMAARHVTGIGLVDASNQGNQGAVRKPNFAYSDSEVQEERWFAEKAEELTREGQYLARKNHFNDPENQW